MLALEYIAKFLIYLVVTLVIVGMIIRFFVGKRICFFDCEEPEMCDVKTLVIDERWINPETLDKYCYLCWEKNEFGKCEKNVLCYVIKGNFYTNQSYVPRDVEHCELRCNRNATSLLFLYDHLRGKVFIEC